MPAPLALRRESSSSREMRSAPDRIRTCDLRFRSASVGPREPHCYGLSARPADPSDPATTLRAWRARRLAHWLLPELRRPAQQGIEAAFKGRLAERRTVVARSPSCSGRVAGAGTETCSRAPPLRGDASRRAAALEQGGGGSRRGPPAPTWTPPVFVSLPAGPCEVRLGYRFVMLWTWKGSGGRRTGSRLRHLPGRRTAATRLALCIGRARPCAEHPSFHRRSGGLSFRTSQAHRRC